METNNQIDTLRTKKLIQQLSEYKGNGTSMISIYIPAGEQISRVSKMLIDEYATATRIKSRENRQSVMSAISSAQQKLKLLSRTPPNGVALFCGMAIGPDGAEKRVNIDLIPQTPIKRAIYMCHSSFHVAPLEDLMETYPTIGFIVMDGNGCLFATVSGNCRTILEEFSVDLPKKHGRGGQSALRFARLRIEKRMNYIRKCAESATRLFVKDNKSTLLGLVVAGSAGFKNELVESDHFNPLLKGRIVSIVDVGYGSRAGFNEAISLSSAALSDLTLMKEKAILQDYFQQLALDSGLSSVGVVQTLKALDMGAVSSLLVWDKFQIEDLATLGDFATLSNEGTQFARGFGGFGALLRWRIDTTEIDNEEENLLNSQEKNNNLKIAAEHVELEEEEEEYEDYEDISSNLESTGGSHRRIQTHGAMNASYISDMEMMFGGSF